MRPSDFPARSPNDGPAMTSYTRTSACQTVAFSTGR